MLGGPAWWLSGHCCRGMSRPFGLDTLQCFVCHCLRVCGYLYPFRGSNCENHLMSGAA